MAVKTIDFSADQRAALDRIEAWRYEDRQTLTLGGFAGSGKTTLTSYLASAWPGVAVAALCGKAANVLRSKGVAAQTIHSLIYEPYTKDGRIHFRKKPFLDAKTIFIDEASMVNTELYEDLLSFGLPVLFIGDHGQLEPIGDNPNLMLNPEIRLEKIHRQAEKNPILRLATAFRQGRPVPDWSSPSGELRVASRSLFMDEVRSGDVDAQYICGFNATRHTVNRIIRERKKFKKLVCVGDRLICLRNNREFGLFNGQQAVCVGVGGSRGLTIEIKIVTEDGDTLWVPAMQDQFGNNPIKDVRRECVLLDYANAITGHKSQGSEFDNVVALEEVSSSWNIHRWRYTVATRAKRRLSYFR